MSDRAFSWLGVNESTRTIVNLYLKSVAGDTLRFEARLTNFEKSTDVSVEFLMLKGAFATIGIDHISADNYRVTVDRADNRENGNSRVQNLLLEFTSESYGYLLVSYSGVFEDEQLNRLRFRALTDPFSAQATAGMARIAIRLSGNWKIILQSCNDKLEKMRKVCGNRGVRENYIKVKPILDVMGIFSIGEVYSCQPQCK